MPRMKKTARRQQMEDIIYEAPPQDHPLEHFFARMDDVNCYLITFADRTEIPPRHLDISLLNSSNFSTLARILEEQGLIEFVQIRENYYPDLVGIAYSTLSVDFNESNEAEFMLKFKLFKRDYEIGCSELASIWNLPYRGSLFDGKKPLEAWGSNIKQESYALFNIVRQPRKKIGVNVFTTEMRVLHYLLNYVLMPRASGHGHVKDEDIITMWAMVNDIKINWTYFIVQHMIRYTKGLSSSGFGYVCLWTRIFRYLGIDVSAESRKGMVPTSVIDTRTIHQMRRSLEAQEQEEQEQAPQGPQVQEQVEAFGQSSIHDMMAILQRIEANQNFMGNRFERVEQSQAHMDRQLRRVNRRLHRIEQYMEINIDEDEDEDQE
ncbi:hypothetical protein PIB30_087410 [Stylosanthes scabra]|uniref:Uncharacterized protein n=1 Tax=Stylosanthes scabra TaxID=79078 RepID=A0ABU6USY3_9FABA|nr:hypothetical protein [Stylosanthes scabra]